VKETEIKKGVRCADKSIGKEGMTEKRTDWWRRRTEI